MNHIPIQCTDPDDRMDGWQVGYFACKYKSMGDASARKDEGGNAQATLITSPAIIRIRPLPHHPDFQPFPYREIKPTIDIQA